MRERVEEFIHIRVVDEPPRLIHREELIQVERVLLLLLIRERDALRCPLAHQLRHLIGEEREARQLRIGILLLARIVPVAFLPLLVRVRPVVDGALRELVIRERLKRRTG